MTTYKALVAEYKRHYRLVVTTMFLNLMWMVLFLLVFPVPEEGSESLGTGGAIMCFVLWISLLVLYFTTLLWVLVRPKDYTMAFGSIMPWLFFIGILSFGYPWWILLLNSLVPVAVTIPAMRMVVFLNKIKVESALSTTSEETTPPKLRLYR